MLPQRGHRPAGGGFTRNGEERVKEGAPERVGGGAGLVNGLGIVPPAIPSPVAVHPIVLRDEEGAEQQ